MYILFNLSPFSLEWKFDEKLIENILKPCQTPALTVNVKQEPLEEETVNNATNEAVIKSPKLPKQNKRKVVTKKILLKKKWNEK